MEIKNRKNRGSEKIATKAESNAALNGPVMKNWHIDPEEYTYDLPQERIAMFPLKNRDESKLLFCDRGRITHHVFSEIPSLLPPDSLLVFNNTKVIPARLQFRKPTGAVIEVFLLNPVRPTPVLAQVMKEKTGAVWKCLIGNLKRWHDRTPLHLDLNQGQIDLVATIADPAEMLVRLTWNDPGKTFSEILELAGRIPLPPYINREPVDEDKVRYQTVYSKLDGAVASSTAGLHFTDDLLKQLSGRNIKMEFITLHISAGTFQPIKSRNAIDHDMHSEQVIITEGNITALLNHNGPVIAVGTTSLRTLESIYWFGHSLLKKRGKEFKIEKLEPYRYNDSDLPEWKPALNAVHREVKGNQSKMILGETGIYILPGYRFKACHGLITNYHLPGSTLILLVAAFAGNDWKRIYAEALMNDYRFLSYGDSSLIIP